VELIQGPQRPATAKVLTVAIVSLSSPHSRPQHCPLVTMRIALSLMR
jgi:hypothetical protein